MNLTPRRARRPVNRRFIGGTWKRSEGGASYAVTERNYARQDESDPWVEFSILIGSYVYDAETRTVDITLDEQVSGKVKVLLPVMTSAKLNPRKETLTGEHEIDNYVYYRYLRD